MGAYIYLPQEWSQGARVRIQIELLMKLQWQMFGVPTSTPETDRHMRPLNFCRKLNSEQFLLNLLFY